VILAFIRYGFLEKFSSLELLLYLVATLAVSFLSFKFIERIKGKSRISRISIVAVFLLTTGVAFMIYRNAGVVRDVPELGITMENPYVNRNTEYIDQIYKLQKPFATGKPHVLIIGNSFARDFACIVKEYDIDEELEMSYATTFEKADSIALGETDYLFVFGAKHAVPDEIFANLKPSCKVYGIGTKCYGKTFGIFYAKRNSPNYFDQSIPSHPIVDSLNAAWKQEWGENSFIDIMAATRLLDGTVRIFTPEHKVISFDCRHLTPDGCKFYATRLNLEKIFEINRDENK